MRRSTSSYPADWSEIAKHVKDEAGWRCVRCGAEHDPEIGRTLTVHHLDLSPANCEWWNLLPLCQACHLSIQGRVDLRRRWFLDHTPWFWPYVAGYYASLRGLPTEREYIMAHLDELLALENRP